MKNLIFISFIFATLNPLFCQEKVEWREDIEIVPSSFKGTVPEMSEDNLQEYSFAVSYDFSFYMANVQFAFTKNFNRYVSAYYIPTHSWIEEGEYTDQLILMSNLNFDLAELYARKFRKRLFESKNVSSNINFANKIHNEINREYIERESVIRSEIRSQENVEDYLKREIEKVNIEIKELGEFCKNCKPKKKKK